MINPVIIIHAGAGPVAPERVCGKICGIQAAAKRGYEVLIRGGKAIDAVECAILFLENDNHFNCGTGSILNEDGYVEMDASIMDGSKLSSGSCALVKNVKNPISLAKTILNKLPNMTLIEDGASEFGKKNSIQIVNPKDLVTEYAKKILERVKKEGLTPETSALGSTVGCVALDINGNIVAGTSTGGTNGKLKGRIGDSPLIGCGTYANNQFGGVSCTGLGEAIIKCANAFSIIKEMEWGTNPMEATRKQVQYVFDKVAAKTGAITISKDGDVGYFFTSHMMPWCYISKFKLHYGLEKEQDFEADVVYGDICIHPDLQPLMEEVKKAAEEKRKASNKA